MEKIIPTEHPDHRGFYFIPGMEYGLISKTGQVMSTITWELLSPRINHKGYLLVNFYIDGKRTGRTIHRLLALTFVGRPERHLDKPHDELEVNHKDGIKINNSIDNLEWLTPAENAQHAHKTGLTSIGNQILARHVLSDEIKSFHSTQACADFFGTERKKLAKHLKSEDAGLVTLGWHVFKYDDGTPWPVVPSIDKVENKWDYLGVLIGYDTITDKISLFNTLKEAAGILGYHYRELREFVARYGEKIPYRGWLFTYHESVLGIDISGLQPLSRKRGPKERVIRVTDAETLLVKTYPNLHEAAKGVSLSPETVRTILLYKGGRYGNLLVERA